MSKAILAIPASMVTHCHEVLAGEYDIEPLKFDTPPVILDLGANIGSFALWARERFPGCVVHCYEPHPENYELLERNLRLETGIVLHPCAVSDFTGPHELWMGKHNPGESSLLRGTCTIEESVTVNVVSGSGLPPAEILKLDTEGSEWAILTTYQHWDRVRAVMFEWHAPEDRERIGKFLEEKGFDLIQAIDTRYIDRGLQKWAKGIQVEKGVTGNSINLLIGMPAYGGMTHVTHNQSLMELRDMLNQFHVRHDPRYLPGDSLIPRARNYYGTMCLEDKDPMGQPYTHLFFCDVDIRFNPRDVISLLALDKDISALPYSAKDLDWDKIIQAVEKGVRDPEALRRVAGRPIINAEKYTTFGINEAVEFPQLGTGLLLIKRGVFEHMAKEQPWRRYTLMKNESTNGDRKHAWDFFQSGVNAETNYYDSEDYRFCLDARKLGFKTWLWPSAVTWHTGNYSFCMDIPTQAHLGINLVGEKAPLPESVPAAQ